MAYKANGTDHSFCDKFCDDYQKSGINRDTLCDFCNEQHGGALYSDEEQQWFIYCEDHRVPLVSCLNGFKFKTDHLPPKINNVRKK